jgi:hypothetical protein
MTRAEALRSQGNTCSKEAGMRSRVVIALAVLLPLSFLCAAIPAPPANAAGEYAKHFGALGALSVEVAKAMPPDQYGFRPHPESMNFGEFPHNSLQYRTPVEFAAQAASFYRNDVGRKPSNAGPLAHTPIPAAEQGAWDEQKPEKVSLSLD